MSPGQARLNFFSAGLNTGFTVKISAKYWRMAAPDGMLWVEAGNTLKPQAFHPETNRNPLGLQ